MNYKKIATNLKKRNSEKDARKLQDMKKYFEDKKEVNTILKKKNPVIYRIYRKKLGAQHLSLTILNPGKISNEYFMTKGHKHVSPSPEIYIQIKGKGKLILGQNKIITLKKNKKVKIKGTTSHRLVNIGKTKLEVITIEDKNTKKNYKVKFKKLK